ncbi:MAG: serine/threonine protein kinase [Planctomycetota bacterium]|nr:serine/threonine protein kinase [Planctomycetota bacterium]
MREADLMYGKLAVKNGFMSANQLQEVMDVLSQEPDTSFDEVVLKRSYITQEQLKALKLAYERLEKDKEKKEMSVTGYEILAKIGEGGLGIVYRARQLSMNRIVALKILHRKWVDDEELRKRFLFEARLLGKLNHPNLITVYDVGREDWKYYFSMEFVEGRTAEEIVEKEGPMEPSYAIEIAIQVAKVINFLKEHNVVHCDVKPGNIIISKDDIAKLGDFGFARIGLELGKGMDETVLGTPEYISPEQAMGKRDLDFRSDIYSLGVSLFHMVTGKPPYEGPSGVILNKHIRAEIPDPKELNKDITRELALVIKKMMAKSPQERYQSVEELIGDLAVARFTEDPKASDSFVGRTTILSAIKKEKMVSKKFQEELVELRSKSSSYKIYLLATVIVLILSLILNIFLLFILK